MQEVCMVEGDRASERVKSEDNGKREKRQAADNRANKNRYLPPPFSMGQIPKKGIF